MQEIEVKIKLPNGFEPNLFNGELSVIHSVFVRDVYYDTIDNTLLKQDKVLRLRSCGDTYQLAYKSSREENSEKMIIRNEFETGVEDFNTIDKILCELNFIHRDIVEKTRTKIQSNYFSKLSITIDKYPFIGCIMEVEGNKCEINEFLKKYNIDKNSIDKRNCTEAFLDYCNKHRIHFDNPRIHFTFRDEEYINN